VDVDGCIWGDRGDEGWIDERMDRKMEDKVDG
jgi:hypothetical protein